MMTFHGTKISTNGNNKSPDPEKSRKILSPVGKNSRVLLERV